MNPTRTRHYGVGRAEMRAQHSINKDLLAGRLLWVTRRRVDAQADICDSEMTELTDNHPTSHPTSRPASHPASHPTSQGAVETGRNRR